MKRFLPHVFAVALAAITCCGPALGDSISGVIVNPERCEGVSAIRRTVRGGRLRFEEREGEFDPQTGRFAISGLEPEEYDLRIRLQGGGCSATRRGRTRAGVDGRAEPNSGLPTCRGGVDHAWHIEPLRSRMK